MHDRPPLEFTTASEVRFSVIWLHGLGADGQDFLPVAQMLDLPHEYPTRFIFPHAPVMPVSINGGQPMPAWYDIYGMDLGARVDTEGIQRSVKTIGDLVAWEVRRGVPIQRVILAGFSQGGLIALATAFALSEPLAGVMALSTYLPRQWELGTQTGLAIFQAHGIHDEIVPLQAALDARARLLKKGCHLEWHEYLMGHTVIPEEIQHIRQWLLARMSTEA